MNEIHGVADALRVQGGPAATERVTVQDGDQHVILNISGATYSAGLTPSRAQFIASALNASARRVAQRLEAEKKAQPKAPQT